MIVKLAYPDWSDGNGIFESGTETRRDEGPNSFKNNPSYAFIKKSTDT